jgi:hypothetical protein
MFAVHYDSLDSFVLILKIDIPNGIFESNPIPIGTRVETIRITLSKEHANQIVVNWDSSSRGDLSVFCHLTERLPVSEYMVCSNSKLTVQGKSHLVLLDFFSLFLSFMAAFSSIKLNAILLAYKTKESSKPNRRTDPVPKVKKFYKAKFEPITVDHKKVNYHLCSTFYKATIKKVEDVNIFLPEYTCRPV